MEDGLDGQRGGAPQRHLDHAEVLQRTMDQLTKDLALEEHALTTPPVPTDAFEALRSQVFPILQALSRRGDHHLRVAMYRVDIPEQHMRRTMARGGLEALAGEVVLRALQKVLTRLRSAGRF